MSKRTASAALALSRGFASAFDIGLRGRNALREQSQSAPADADGKAIAADWARVGGDLARAAEKLKSEQQSGSNVEKEPEPKTQAKTPAQSNSKSLA